MIIISSRSTNKRGIKDFNNEKAYPYITQPAVDCLCMDAGLCYSSTVMGVPDQYRIRGGLNFHFQNIALTTCLRYEKVPAEDLIGGSLGFPGAASITSIEPGIIYKMKRSFVFVYAGVPFKRATQQSIPDKLTSDITGNYTITQGGFADYLIFAGIQFKL